MVNKIYHNGAGGVDVVAWAIVSAHRMLPVRSLPLNILGDTRTDHPQLQCDDSVRDDSCRDRRAKVSVLQMQGLLEVIFL